MDRGDFLVSLTAGGLAGVCVDLILFPLDTVKTRLQSPQGFKKAGGFRGIYAGVPSTAVGSFPNAAAFFATYEFTKATLRKDASPYLSPLTHMLAASLGEVVACLIRVPSEVVKQRAQVSPSSSTLRILTNTVCEEGILGLYRGYKSTVLREIPFSLVQFPLWESLKDLWSWKQGHVVDSWQSAVCGAFAGAKDYMLSWEMLKKKGREEGKCANLLRRAAQQHSFIIPVCLEQRKWSLLCVEEGERKGSKKKGEVREPRKGCLFERQPICF
ncbi:S-adenosylmethionine mitochondrial carrier protein isoform X1 [Podarcis raffonei]|uniref:S-adenosylmethionine mitochondrial carrier protein isoform X1 n=1 Tax=Podarcis raffonei TaxID=65483 RepID=UPI00232941ED|nr:S-adenosylmethionine mitochondrial carrier protein isoform X1 [Podarcis raffonei]